MGEKVVNSLFLYGTLQPGEENHHMVETIVGQWRSASIRGHLVDKGWGAEKGFPALVIDERGDEVKGHLLTSPDLDQWWCQLDQLEGEEYRRVVSQVLLEDKSSTEAFIYVLNE